MRLCEHCNKELTDSYRIPIHEECEVLAQEEVWCRDINHLEEWEFNFLIDEEEFEKEQSLHIYDWLETIKNPIV